MPNNPSISKYPRQIEFKEYQNSFSYELLKDFEEGRLDGFDMETMRGLIYGYTFTEDYAKGLIPVAFSMDYWKQKNKNRFANANKNILYDAFSALSLSEYLGQEQLICDAINSTGEGISKDKPFCVICVEHEYEFLRRAWPMEIKSQRLLVGNIDCFELEGDYGQEIYFDINRWFERRTSCYSRTK